MGTMSQVPCTSCRGYVPTLGYGEWSANHGWVIICVWTINDGILGEECHKCGRYTAMDGLVGIALKATLEVTLWPFCPLKHVATTD